MKLHFSVVLLVISVALFALAAFDGCKSSTGPSSQGQISMTVKYSPGQPPPATIVPRPKSSGVAAVDSIRIDSARFVIRKIEFETVNDSTEFNTVPFVLKLNLSGSIQNISVANVPFGTYEEIEFEVHRVDTLEVNALPLASRGQFQDFLAGNRSSIIIDGIVYKTGLAPQAFSFRSRVDASQKARLSPPLAVGDGSPIVNASMVISSGNWFRSVGTFLDPTDPANESVISDSLRASIRVFKDNDKDGSRDSN